MAVPQSIHVYPVTLRALPYQDDVLDALFYVEIGQQTVERTNLFREACRILKPSGLLFVSQEQWLNELTEAGFSQPMVQLPLAIPAQWRAAYVSIYNGRLHLTELEKSHVFPMKSPFFQTAICVIKLPTPTKLA